ncbi:MAG TPA: hypothetical protein VF735_09455 [Pyrinomonadaceae bacterium]|jgi:hypothetical protein
MKPAELSDIESEIRATETLEASSMVTDVPSTMTRDVTMFDGQATHTDTGVDVVVDIDVDIDDDVLAVVDVDIDVDVDVDTHVDQ